jgi:hypothetical protein
MEDLKKLSEILSKKTNPILLESAIQEYETVFSNCNALAFSFRKGDIEFLRSSADFDYPALDLLINLYRNFETLRKRLNKAVVSNNSKA